MNRRKINDVPCRVCGAEPGEQCHRPGGKALVHGWHGGRVDDAARAKGLLPPITEEVPDVTDAPA